MLLDGQKVQLDQKYGRVFEKANVPIIMLANQIPQPLDQETLYTRVFIQRFTRERPFPAPLDPSRLASTLAAIGSMYLESVRGK